MENFEQFQKCKKEYGSVIFENIEYALDQNAYICDDGQQYKALAINEKGEDFMVYWDVTIDNPEECDDESNMCNWENPVDVVLI